MYVRKILQFLSVVFFHSRKYTLSVMNLHVKLKSCSARCMNWHVISQYWAIWPSSVCLISPNRIANGSCSCFLRKQVRELKKSKNTINDWYFCYVKWFHFIYVSGKLKATAARQIEQRSFMQTTSEEKHIAWNHRTFFVMTT